MKSGTYAVIFVISLFAMFGFESALTSPWSMGHSCPSGVLVYSYVPHGFQMAVGPPLFSVSQYVMAPGTTAKVTVILSPYDGNNLSELLRIGGYSSGGSNYSQIVRIGHFDTFSLVQLNGTGVSITSSKIVQISQNEAIENLTIVANPNADQTTYDLGALDCPGAVLVTIGYLPYWEPFLGSVQVMTLLVSILLATVITLSVLMADRLVVKRNHASRISAQYAGSNS